MDDKYESLDSKFDTLNSKFGRLDNQQKVTDRKVDRTTAILEDTLFRIIDWQKGQNGFVPCIKNLEEGVEIIEEKIAT